MQTDILHRLAVFKAEHTSAGFLDARIGTSRKQRQAHAESARASIDFWLGFLFGEFFFKHLSFVFVFVLCLQKELAARKRFEKSHSGGKEEVLVDDSRIGIFHEDPILSVHHATCALEQLTAAYQQLRESFGVVALNVLLTDVLRMCQAIVQTSMSCVSADGDWDLQNALVHLSEKVLDIMYIGVIMDAVAFRCDEIIGNAGLLEFLLWCLTKGPVSLTDMSAGVMKGALELGRLRQAHAPAVRALQLALVQHPVVGTAIRSGMHDSKGLLDLASVVFQGLAVEDIPEDFHAVIVSSFAGLLIDACASPLDAPDHLEVCAKGFASLSNFPDFFGTGVSLVRAVHSAIQRVQTHAFGTQAVDETWWSVLRALWTVFLRLGSATGGNLLSCLTEMEVVDDVVGTATQALEYAGVCGGVLTGLSATCDVIVTNSLCLAEILLWILCNFIEDARDGFSMPPVFVSPSSTIVSFCMMVCFVDLFITHAVLFFLLWSRWHLWWGFAAALTKFDGRLAIY